MFHITLNWNIKCLLTWNSELRWSLYSLGKDKIQTWWWLMTTVTKVLKLLIQFFKYHWSKIEFCCYSFKNLNWLIQDPWFTGYTNISSNSLLDSPVFVELIKVCITSTYGKFWFKALKNLGYHQTYHKHWPWYPKVCEWQTWNINYLL